MPRYTNPRWKRTGPSITLPKGLKGIAIAIAVGATIAAVVTLLGARSSGWIRWSKRWGGWRRSDDR